MRILKRVTPGKGQLDHLAVGLSCAGPSVGPYGHAQGLLGLIPLHSSTMLGYLSWIIRRTSATVSACQPPRDRIRSSIRSEAAFPVARFASAPG
jgi:hypothetical protein